MSYLNDYPHANDGCACDYACVRYGVSVSRSPRHVRGGSGHASVHDRDRVSVRGCVSVHDLHFHGHDHNSDLHVV